MVDSSKVVWRQIDATVNDEPLSVLARVRETAPAIVCATLYLFNRLFLEELLGYIRREMPKCLLVVGGPECLGDNRTIMPGFTDVAVRGEGEVAFSSLLQRVAGGGCISDIPGVCAMENGVYCDNGVANEVGLDAIPNFYPDMLAGFSRPFVQLETSRGCPNGCLFCTSRETPVRYKSIERVREELTAIRLAGVRTVRLVDRTFNLTTRRSLELLRLFREESPGMRFHLEIDPGVLSAEVAEEMGRAPVGSLHLEVGVQSLEEQAYALLQRRATPEETLDGVKQLVELGNVEIHADLMSGLPRQTLGGLIKDAVVLMQAGVEEIQLERLKLLPGTPLAQNPALWGLVVDPLPPYKVLQTPEMSVDDLREADRLAKVLDWYYNKPVLREVFAEAFKDDEQSLVAFVNHCAERTEFGICPNLETRLRIMDSFWSDRSARMTNRVRYLWFRHGSSTRKGLCPAESWRGSIPGDAELIEGDRGGRFSKIWRVELDVPHYFCFGTGTKGERAVLAVFKGGAKV